MDTVRWEKIKKSLTEILINNNVTVGESRFLLHDLQREIEANSLVQN